MKNKIYLFALSPNKIFVYLITFILFTYPNVLSANNPEGSRCLSGDCENGYGVLIWEKGDPSGVCLGKKYEGYFKKGQPYGYGKLFFPCTGVVYFGEFANGKEHGFGSVQWPEGNGFIGEWKNGKENGVGLTFDKNGSKRLGILKDGMPENYGLGLTLLKDGAVKREDIYKINPTPDKKTNSGVYIPKDLNDCFKEFKSMLMPEFIEKIKTGTEEGMNEYHFGLGMWIRNNWGLWDKSSPLVKYFNNLGIFHPDDMSGIILTSFYRYLNGKNIDLEGRIKRYQDFWEKQKQSQDDLKHDAIRKLN